MSSISAADRVRAGPELLSHAKVCRGFISRADSRKCWRPAGSLGHTHLCFFSLPFQKHGSGDFIIFSLSSGSIL